MARRKKTDSPVSFQITPMIDMTFLLLVFFMITSTLTEQQVKKDIRLPTAAASITPDDLSNRDIINIDGDGDYFIADRKVTKDEMKAYLKMRFEVQPPLKIYLRADKDTPAKITGEFMDMATDAGATNVIFGVLND